MRILILIILIFSVPFISDAAQKYNLQEKRWEMVPNDWKLKRNYVTQEWSYQPQNARVEFNIHNRKWEWNSGHNVTKQGGRQ